MQESAKSDVSGSPGRGDRSLLVWIFQTGEPLQIDEDHLRPMRAINLSDALIDAGHRVVIWSSTFNHQKKIHRRSATCRLRVSERVEIRLIHSRGYRRSIGAGRLIDHAQMARELNRVLKQVDVLPDVAFIGYPPIEATAVMTRWLARRGVPSLLDIKDRWPQLFVSSASPVLRPALRILTLPYFYLARRAMRDATALSAMAPSFLDWAIDFSGRDRSPNDNSFPLTSQLIDLSELEIAEAGRWWDARGVEDDGTVRLIYVGSHTRTLDFEPIRIAAELSAEDPDAPQFVICGDGDRSAELQRIMAGLPNVDFPGWIDRPKLEVLAARSHASLVPYRNTRDFRMSLPNKVIDALALGLPILCPLQGEVESLISDHSVGLRYGGDSGRTLRDCVVELTGDPSLQARLSENALATYRERFCFEQVYGELVACLERLVTNGP